MTDDIVRGMEPGTATNLGTIPILLVWLYGAVVLAERRSGHVIMLLGALLAAVVPVLTHRLRRPIAGGSVKEEQDAVNIVEFHEIEALATELLSADEITPAGGECTATTGHVEAIVLREPQFIGEKGVRGLLEPAVRAGDNQNVGANGLPLTMERTSHCCSVPAPPNA